MSVVYGVLIAFGILGFFSLMRYVILPYFVLQRRRAASASHVPQPEEIWVQDDSIFYVDTVSPTGVELMSLDPQSKQFMRWKDSWPEWQQRLKSRTVFFTGNKRPLGPM